MEKISKKDCQYALNCDNAKLQASAIKFLSSSMALGINKKLWVSPKMIKPEFLAPFIENYAQEFVTAEKPDYKTLWELAEMKLDLFSGLKLLCMIRSQQGLLKPDDAIRLKKWLIAHFPNPVSENDKALEFLSVLLFYVNKDGSMLNYLEDVLIQQTVFPKILQFSQELSELCKDDANSERVINLIIRARNLDTEEATFVILDLLWNLGLMGCNFQGVQKKIEKEFLLILRQKANNLRAITFGLREKEAESYGSYLLELLDRDNSTFSVNWLIKIAEVYLLFSPQYGLEKYLNRLENLFRESQGFRVKISENAYGFNAKLYAKLTQIYVKLAIIYPAELDAIAFSAERIIQEYCSLAGVIPSPQTNLISAKKQLGLMAGLINFVLRISVKPSCLEFRGNAFILMLNNLIWENREGVVVQDLKAWLEKLCRNLSEVKNVIHLYECYINLETYVVNIQHKDVALMRELMKSFTEALISQSLWQTPEVVKTDQMLSILKLDWDFSTLFAGMKKRWQKVKEHNQYEQDLLNFFSA